MTLHLHHYHQQHFTFPITSLALQYSRKEEVCNLQGQTENWLRPFLRLGAFGPLAFLQQVKALKIRGTIRRCQIYYNSRTKAGQGRPWHPVPVAFFCHSSLLQNKTSIPGPVDENLGRFSFWPCLLGDCCHPRNKLPESIETFQTTFRHLTDVSCSIDD